MSVIPEFDKAEGRKLPGWVRRPPAELWLQRPGGDWTWRASQRREEEPGRMQGGREKKCERRRRRRSLSLSGSAGLQIWDPWCPGFQSGGEADREERRREQGEKRFYNVWREEKRGRGDSTAGEGRHSVTPPALHTSFSLSGMRSKCRTSVSPLWEWKSLHRHDLTAAACSSVSGWLCCCCCCSQQLHAYIYQVEIRSISTVSRTWWRQNTPHNRRPGYILLVICLVFYLVFCFLFY